MVKKRLDLTGETYTNLYVIKEVTPKGGHRRYLCDCKCGKQLIVNQNALRKGQKSCGCIKRGRVIDTEHADLTDKRFGKLTVIKKVEGKRNHSWLWFCECDCGGDGIFEHTKLIHGNNKSCGCLIQESVDKLQDYKDEHYFKDDVYVPALYKKTSRTSTTGVKGVTEVQRKSGIRYVAKITLKYKQMHLGTFDTIEEATEARQRAEQEYYQPYLS